jgi:PmbA protein
MKDKFVKLVKQREASGELFQINSYRMSVSYENSHFKGIEEGETSGFAVRVMKGGKVGFSYATGSLDLEHVVEAAFASMEFSKDINFKFATLSKEIPQVSCFDEKIVKEDREVAIDLGRDFVEFVKELKDGIQAAFLLSKNIIEEQITTTEGFDSAFKKTEKNISVGGFYTEEGNFLEVFAGEARSRNDLFDLDTLKEKIKSNILAARHNVSISSGNYPVIFTPFSVGELMRPLLVALNGQNVLKGFSMLKGKLGQEVFAPELTVVDNPRLSGGAYSFPFDDEGTISERKELIAKGQVRNYLADRESASRLHIYGGNAQRSLSSLPRPSTSNIVIQTGVTPLNNMLNNSGRAILIEGLMGTMMGNTLGGFVTGNIELGYLIENGNIVGRVKDAMINFNIFDALKDIAVSQENIWTDKYLSPYIYLPSVSISVKR